MPQKPDEPFVTTNKVKIDTELSKFNKSEKNTQLFKSMLADITLYTDGTYKNGANAYAIIQQTSESVYLNIKLYMLFNRKEIL